MNIRVSLKRKETELYFYIKCFKPINNYNENEIGEFNNGFGMNIAVITVYEIENNSNLYLYCIVLKSIRNKNEQHFRSVL